MRSKGIRNLSPDEWSSINEQSLTEIFAESGADRELDFDRENLEEEYYFNPRRYKKRYPQLIYKIEDKE